MADETVISVEGVSKKFCRNLRQSLWYGVKDSVRDLTGRNAGHQPLRRDEFWAVEDVSFSLKRGECIGLIGHNGAGKTTLLRLLGGLIKPDRGQIEIRGRLGALIALGAGFNPVLSGRENIYVNGAVLGLSKREIDAKYDEIVDFADIGDFIDAPVQSYSSGMQVRLGFAVAVAVRPDILLLDEVLAVGDADFQTKCLNTLARFRQGGTSFILVAHNSHMISRYCQSVLYLKGGKTVFRGDVETGLAMMGREMAQKGVRGDEEEIDWDTPRGSGRLRFTSAEFRDADGRPVTTARVGEPLTLALGYERIDPSIRSVRLDLLMCNGNEVLYQGDSASAKQALSIDADRGALLVNFGYIAANVSDVKLYFAVLDPENAEVLDWKRGLRLLIDRRAMHLGGVFMPVTWTVASRAEANVARVAG